MPRILSVGTALPAHRYAQAEIRDVYAAHDPAAGKRLAVFDRAGVETRSFAKPLAELADPPSFERRAREFVEFGLALGAEALEGAARSAGRPLAELDQLIAVTTTGLATP